MRSTSPLLSPESVGMHLAEKIRLSSSSTYHSALVVSFAL